MPGDIPRTSLRWLRGLDSHDTAYDVYPVPLSDFVEPGPMTPAALFPALAMWWEHEWPRERRRRQRAESAENRGEDPGELVRTGQQR